MEKKGKRIETINGGNPFPEAVIQLIQSFLPGKKAAQTTILSKSWHSAWLTRPNLDFQDCNGFLEIVTNTLQRYQDSHLQIESFSLRRMSCEDRLTHELVVKALKLGATHLNLEFINPQFEAVLPQEILGSETLIGLSLRGCMIGGGGNGKVRCSKLESLTLSNVFVADSVIQDIFSSCPLIHKLSFHDIKSGVDHPTIFSREDQCEFHKLKCLLLEEVGVSPSFFNSFSSKFPCLKNLSIHACRGFETIQISSPSLESASFELDIKKAEFDFPKIRKFKFGIDRENARIDPVPTLSMKTLSTEWESRVSMGLSKNPITSQFLKRLKVFLTKLSSSKISLYLSARCMFGESIDFTEYFRGLPKVVVENLDLFVTPHVFPATVEGLFCICRPKLITIISFPFSFSFGEEDKEEEEPKYLIKFLLRRLKAYESVQSDLREVHVSLRSLSGESSKSFELVPLETFLFDVSRKVRFIKQIRWFELRWGQ